MRFRTRGRGWSGGVGANPSLSLDFLNNVYSTGSLGSYSSLSGFLTAASGSFTRATNAWYFDSSGTLVQASSGVARFDHDPSTLQRVGLLMEPTRTNAIRNNSMSGASAGTPGTAPTNWSIGGNANGISRDIAVGTEDGIPYIDVRFYGTASSSHNLDISPETTTGITAANAQTWAASLYISRIAGTMANVDSTIFSIHEATSGGVFVTEGQLAYTVGTGSLRTNRIVHHRTLSGGGTVARAYPLYRFSVTNGATVDFTVRIGAPQFEQGAAVTSPILTTSSAVARNSDVLLVGNSSNWINTSRGTFVTRVTYPAIRWVSGMPTTDYAGPRIRQENSFSNELRHRAYDDSTGRSTDAVFMSGGVGVVVGPATDAVSPVSRVISRATAYESTSDFASSVFGQAAVAATPASFPSAFAEFIAVGGLFHMRQIQYFPHRLTNLQLRALSS